MSGNGLLKVLGIDDSRQLTCMLPLHRVRERLSVYVSGLISCVAIAKVILLLLQAFKEPSHAHSVSPADVPHSRVIARLAHTDHSLVVFAESQVACTLHDLVHHGQSWYAFGTQTKSTGNDLGLRRAMAHGSLLFGNARNGKLSPSTRNV